MTTNAEPSINITASLDSLPSPPFVAMEIIRLTRDEDSAGDLAAVLSQDPVLATRILQIANSPAYGLSREVTSIDRATALLGLKAVKMMALSFSLASEMADSSGVLSMETYWYHSLLNAVAARRWAEQMTPGMAEEAFLVGLLSHLGRLVLAESKPVEFAKVLASNRTGWPTHADEANVFGFSSADVTSLILREWGLPELICESGATMYRDHDVDPAVNGAAHLAEVLANVVTTEEALSDHAGPEAVDALHQRVAEAGVDVDLVDDFVLDLEERVRAMGEMLDVKLPDDMSHQRMLDEARTRLVAVSLEAVQNLHTVERAAEELRASNLQFEGMAFEDRLTGVPNRAAFDDHLSRVIAGAVRQDGGAVGMLLFDIDHFKKFNDTYGHQTGDDVLREVGRVANNVTRADELFARYGGEEFALVAVDCTLADLLVTGERIRQTVEELRVPSASGPLAVTVSGGAAVINPVSDRDAAERLIKLADEAL